MPKTPLAALTSQLAHAKLFVPVGTTYRHNGSQTVYEVTGHAIQEETQRVQVLYRKATLAGIDNPGESNPVWARDFNLFNDPDRFTRVVATPVWTEA